MRIKVCSSKSSFSSLLEWPSLSNEKYTPNHKNICKWTLLFIQSRCFLALHQNFQWASHLAKKFSNSLQPLPDAPMNIYERFSSAEGEWKIYDVWLMIFFENIWCVIDDLFWWKYMTCNWWFVLIFLLLKIYEVCLMIFSPAEGELKIYDVGLVIFWKYVFLKNMMSFSSAEGELKIYDVGLMVWRLQRKKRNISQTPDKEIRKIWLEN